MAYTEVFWFFAGIALVILATGYGCGRDWNDYESKARADFYQACAGRVQLGYDVPGVCNPQRHEAGRADRLDAQP